MAYTTGWADLPLDVLDGVMARLPFPSDRARFAAVCRAWRSAMRQLPSHLPWIVFPSGTFCTAGQGAACFSSGILGIPDNTTCIGAAHDCWLALDCTDDVRRTGTTYQEMRNTKHHRTYLLYNPFSSVTVPLSELDAVVGHVAETFKIRKVLMRSPAPDDIIAVTTNNSNYNIILCRPGKGTFVLPYYRIIDVVFLGDTLYGITSGEELLAFYLGEDEDGRPNVTRIELVIKNPLSRYYYYYSEEFPWLWPEDVVDTSDDGVDPNDHNNGGEELPDSDEEDEDSTDEEDRDSADDVEEPSQVENDDNADEENEDDESDVDELADQALEDIFIFNGDDEVSNNGAPEEYDVGFDDEVPDEPKDQIRISRYLVKSRTEELLLVRHRYLSSPLSDSYTHNVEVLKADLSKGKWATSNGLAKGEALFLGQSYSKCTQAHGDIQEGFVYYPPHLLDDAYDMTSYTACDIEFGWPWQCIREAPELLTWLFPPEVVL